MKVNILTQDRGWILERYAKELEKRLKYVTINDNSNKEYDLTYFINYAIAKPVNSKKTAALFTHIEKAVPQLKEKFFQTAKEVDICISLCKKYEKIIKNINPNTFVISHGIDINIYKLTLTLGFVGRFYDYTDRKGKDLLKKIEKLKFVKVLYATGNIKNSELPEKFYNKIDYTIITSKYEGGPMCLIESLALGIKVIAPSDVGMVLEFKKGIHRYRNSNYRSLKKTLIKLYKKKMELYNQVSKRTWDNFASKHDKIFKKYIKNI